MSVALLAASAAVAGCGSQAKSAAASGSQITTAFKGSPQPLATLHAEADKLLGGGLSAFHAELATLKGYPVVINKWASWCGPCQSEFPAFQKAGLMFGRRVAFVGIDGKQDSPADAAKFLRSFPVTYPSYRDPDEAIARTIQAASYYPLTVFIDKAGKIQFVHPGAYPSTADLERDIRRYALG